MVGFLNIYEVYKLFAFLQQYIIMYGYEYFNMICININDIV